MASATDYFHKVGLGTATTLSSPGYTTGDASINVGSTTNWPADTGVTFAIDEVDSAGLRVPGTYNVFRGKVANGTQIDEVIYEGGDPNRNYSAGATTRVYILVSAYRDNRFTDGILEEHKQNGTHGDITADTLTVAGDTVLGGTEGRLKEVRKYTADDTWTKPANLKFVIVEVQAGGGGGGGMPATSASQRGSAGGGAGGGYSRKKILAAILGTTETVTVGTGGSGGSAGANAGAGGGSSSFGTHCSASGGGGGSGGSAVGAGGYGSHGSGAGGSGTNGDINISGQRAFPATTYDARTMSYGAGGAAHMSPGGSSGETSAPTGFGGGGGGMSQGTSTSASAGGSGAGGIVIVHEYF